MSLQTAQTHDARGGSADAAARRPAYLADNASGIVAFGGSFVVIVAEYLDVAFPFVFPSQLVDETAVAVADGYTA